MICAWLLYYYQGCTPDNAIDFFAEMRTDTTKGEKTQGIETKSQKRFVNYFYQFLQEPEILDLKCTLEISSVEFGPMLPTHKDEEKWCVHVVSECVLYVACARALAAHPTYVFFGLALQVFNSFSNISRSLATATAQGTGNKSAR